MSTIAVHPYTAARTPSRRRWSGTAWALFARDAYVLRSNFGEFVAQILIQPLLLVFVFTYLLPKSGISLGGRGFNFATVLLPGLLASTALTTGIGVVAAPLSADLGATREIDDRAGAPIPLWLIAIEKIIFGAWQALLAGLLVFPLAYLIPAAPVHVQIADVPQFALVIVLASLLSSSAGLLIGCLIRPERIGILYGLLVIPMTFLGCVYYPWAQLARVQWAQILVLVNPLVYLSEAMRAVLTPTVAHMAPAAYLGASTGMLALLLALAIRHFTRRLQQ